MRSREAGGSGGGAGERTRPGVNPPAGCLLWAPGQAHPGPAPGSAVQREPQGPVWPCRPDSSCHRHCPFSMSTSRPSSVLGALGHSPSSTHRCQREPFPALSPDTRNQGLHSPLVSLPAFLSSREAKTKVLAASSPLCPQLQARGPPHVPGEGCDAGPGPLCFPAHLASGHGGLCGLRPPCLVSSWSLESCP